MARLKWHRWDLVVSGLIALTGLVGLFAILAPDVVAFGSYLVLPFLVLHPAPTLFFYAVIFGAAWFSVGRVHRLFGLAVGLIAIWAVGWALPNHLNNRFTADELRLGSSKVALLSPVSSGGTVAIVQELDPEISDPVRARFECGKLCRYILYGDYSPAVIVGRRSAKGGHPADFRLWQIDRQDGPCEVPTLVRDNIHLGDMSFTTEIDIKSRALAGECLTSRPASLAEATLILEQETIGKPLENVDRHLVLHPEASGQRVTLSRQSRAGERKILAHEAWLEPRKLSVPLQLSIAGSPNSGAFWELSRQPRARRHGIDVAPWLKLNAADIRGADPDDLRHAVDMWLERPELVSSSIRDDLQRQYFLMIEKHGDEKQDLPRVVSLLRDARFGPPAYLPSVVRRFPARAPEIRELVLDRIALLPPKDPRVLPLSGVLYSFPSASFDPMPPKLLELLENPLRRRHMATAITKLGDAGPPAASVLFKIAEESFSQTPEPEMDAGVAAIAGLCAIAPRIKPMRDEVERIVAAYPKAAERIRHRGYWLVAVTRVRLGRPAEEIADPVPKNTIITRWPERLRSDAANGVCEIK